VEAKILDVSITQSNLEYSLDVFYKLTVKREHLFFVLVLTICYSQFEITLDSLEYELQGIIDR